MKNIFILILFCITSFTIQSQTSIMYTTEGDISSSLINHIYQDKKGFIWISTEYGLNVFDGYKFNQYKHDETAINSICNNYARVTYEDTQGNIWIGTVAGMMKFNKGTKDFTYIPFYIYKKEILPHVSHILETKEGEIIVATSNQGAFKIDMNTLRGEYIRSISNENALKINALIEAEDGSIWIGTEDSGIKIFDKEKNTTTNFLPSILGKCNITCMTLSKENIYIGTFTDGLYIYNLRNNKINHIKKYNTFNIKTLQFHKNELYIGTDGNGISIYSELNNNITELHTDDPIINLQGAKVHSILLDRDENLWLGIFQKGVIFIPKKTNPFRYIGNKMLSNSPIEDGCVMSIHKNSQGNIFVGIDSKGLYILDDKYKLIKHFLPQENNNSVPQTIVCIFEDSNKNIWLGSYGHGVCRINYTTGRCEYIPELKQESVFSITEDKNKNLYFSSYGAGLFVYNLKTKTLKSYKENGRAGSKNHIPDNWINSLYCDSEGYIWIGHFKGLSCLNPQTNSFINFSSTNYILSNKLCYSITEDVNKMIWIGTSEGLYTFNKRTKKITKYDKKNGLANEVICGLCEDREGNIWISTFNGISKFNKKKETFTNYFSEDGLQGNEFTRGAIHQSTDGEIFFGGTNGITCFYPSEITETLNKPKLILSDFQIFGNSINTQTLSGNHYIIKKELEETDTFYLSHNDNTFRLLFTTFDFGNTTHILYKYKIKQLDQNWLSTRNGENYITFNNLQPGKYTIQVFAVDRENQSDIHTYHINISSPWYESWWAYILYSVPFIILIWLIINYIRIKIRRRQDFMEIRHAKEINEAKLQFFINISHEIRTPMTLIINPLEKLIATNQNKDIEKTYMMIYRNAKRILRLINQLMDIRKIEKGQMKMHFRETDMVNFINDLMITFENTARQKNIDFQFIHENPTVMAWIDINNFDKVLMNLMSNAFKYTPDNGKVYIILKQGENPNVRTPLKNYIEIQVIDTGIGLDEKQKEHIFERFYQISGNGIHNQGGTGVGLHLTQSLVEMHYGIITAENNKNTSGSTFTVRIPAGCSHINIEQIDNSEDNNITPAVNYKNMPIITSVNEETLSKKKTRTNFHILIVDDEKEIQEYLKEELKDEYKISLASNGYEAYEYLLTNHIDLVISDIMMSEMDGLTLCRKIKQNTNINHLPVILLTAKGKTEEQIEGIENGADAYIIKPFHTDVLKSTISNLLQSRRILKNKFSGAQEQQEKIKEITIKSSDETLMEKIMTIINQNISEPTLNVETLAQEVGLSRVHLHRKLKELTNLSPRDFIKNIRMKQAAKLLKEKKLSISEVAYAVGYNNLSHFSSTFKETFGISPKEYMTDSKKKETPEHPDN